MMKHTCWSTVRREQSWKKKRDNRRRYVGSGAKSERIWSVKIWRWLICVHLHRALVVLINVFNWYYYCYYYFLYIDYLLHRYSMLHGTDPKTGLHLWVCVSLCVSVCGHCHDHIYWSIFTKIGTDARTPKVKTSSLGVKIAPPFPPFCPPKTSF